MDDEIESLVVRVRADTSGLARDVATMRSSLEGPLAQGAELAGRGIESALLRATRTGKFGFEDLKKVALSVLADIAASAIRGGLGALFGGGGGGGGGGLGGLLGSILGGLTGAPGRATGGPVSPGRAYRVGERGPEWFVPTTSGQVALPGAGGGGRDVRVTIAIQSNGNDSAQALAQSSRQVARAVRAAIERAE